MKFESASDVQELVSKIAKTLEFDHIDVSRIVSMRSFDSKSRAIARIWSLPRIWQKALGVEAHYILEVLSEHFDHLNTEEKDKVIIHELLHVPKTFSGALVPHKCFGKRIDKKRVDGLYDVYKEKKSD